MAQADRWDRWTQWHDLNPKGSVDEFLAQETESAAGAEQRPVGAVPWPSWSEAPTKTAWGAGMMVCDIALSKDETLTMYAHKDALHLVAEALAVTQERSGPHRNEQL